MSLLQIRLALATVVVCAAAGPAFGQDPPQAPTSTTRPTRGLFGGGIGETGQLLTANFSVGGGYEDVLVPEGVPARRSGNGSASLSYSVDRDRLSGNFSARGTARYYSGSGDLVRNYGATAGVGFRLANATMLSASQHFSVAPYNVMQFYQQAALGGAVWVDPITNTVIDPEFTAGGGEFYNLSSNVDFSHQLFRRMSIGIGYQRTQSGVGLSNQYPAYQSARAGVSYAMARGVNLRAGYGAGLRGRQTAGLGRYRSRTIDAGIDFNRALSLSRRASLSFNSGAVGLDDGVNRRYTLIGHVRFNYQLGRSWTAGLAVRRSADFADSIDTPLVGENMTLSVSGLLSRRLQFNTNVGASRGRAGVASTDPKFNTAFAGIGLNVALTRQLSLGTNYSFFRYRFDSDTILPVGVSPRRERQSIRVHLNAWLPLVVRTRRPNASR